MLTRSLFAAVVASGLSSMMGAPVSAAAITADVQREINQAVADWLTTGNADALRAKVNDQCAANPSIALDITAYAAQQASKAFNPGSCTRQSPPCPSLSELLSRLYDVTATIAAPTRPKGRLERPTLPDPGDSCRSGGSCPPIEPSPGDVASPTVPRRL
jgi:hypothetical protein